MRDSLLITRLTFGELGRQPAVLVMMGLAVFATSGGWWWRDFNFGDNESQFLLNFAGGVQGLFVALLCITGIAHTWAQEFERHTLSILRTRGVNPLSLVVGKTLGVSLMGMVFLVLSSVWLVITLRAEVSVMEWQRFAIDVCLRGGKMMLVATCATWFATYGKSLAFVVLASASLVVLGNLHGMIDGEGIGGRLLKLIVPDLRWVDSAYSVYGLPVDLSAWGGRFAYVLIYATVFTGLAAWSLSRHED